MASLTQAFASAEPAWVQLSKLFPKIERDLGISPAIAITALRPGFESFAIRTDVVNWDPWLPGGEKTVDWAQWHRERDAHCVAEEGWKHVDWEAGTLNGCVVRVMWSDVRRELGPIAAAQQRFRRDEGESGE